MDAKLLDFFKQKDEEQRLESSSERRKQTSICYMAIPTKDWMDGKTKTETKTKNEKQK